MISCWTPRVSLIFLCAAVALTSLQGALKIPPMIRAGGTVYLKVEKGETKLTVYKRDLNIYPGADTVKVTVRDPLMRAMDHVTLPDDGTVGRGGGDKSLQRHTFRIQVDSPGVLAVSIATNGDLVWGLETDAKGLVIHSGMMLNAPTFHAKVYFAPPKGEFNVEAQAIHIPGAQSMPMLDAKERQIHAFELKTPGKFVPFTVGENVGDRSGLWQFVVAKADVKMKMGKLRHWTLDPAWWFELPDDSATMLPKHVVRYLSTGSQSTVKLRLYAPEPKTGDFRLRLVPDRDATVLRASVARIIPAPIPGTTAVRVVEVNVSAPPNAKEGDVSSGWICAENDKGAVAAVRLEVRVGKSPVSQSLKLPIENAPHAHENVTYGYAPDYVPNEVYFSPDNRAFIRNRWTNREWTSAVMIRQGSVWEEHPFLDALDRAFPEGWRIIRGAGFVNCKIAFDGQGGIYTVLRTGHSDKIRRVLLLYSFDNARTWQTTTLEGSAYDIENFSGHNALSQPPPLLVHRLRAKHATARWGAYYNLFLYLPKRHGGALELGDPIKITDDCLGSCQHSGGPPSLATRDGKTHIVWAQAVETDVPGVPTYITTVDHATRSVSPHVFIGHAPPINDVHNVPAVCFDSNGILHVVTGAHGANFMYRHSLQPNDTQSGFSPAVKTLDAGYVDTKSDADGRGRQTYCSLVCDDQDTLHIAFRQWRQGVDDYFGGSNYAALSIQSKPNGQPWGPARPMVTPPLSGYSIYYHKLTIDRTGELWLSYSLYSGTKSYQNQFPEPYNNNAIIVSKDHGATWKLAETRDFPGGGK